jgi:hypothetical protein
VAPRSQVVTSISEEFAASALYPDDGESLRATGVVTQKITYIKFHRSEIFNFWCMYLLFIKRRCQQVILWAVSSNGIGLTNWEEGSGLDLFRGTVARYLL